LRARDFPTERVLSRTPLIIRTVDQNKEGQEKRKTGQLQSSLRCVFIKAESRYADVALHLALAWRLANDEGLKPRRILAPKTRAAVSTLITRVALILRSSWPRQRHIFLQRATNQLTMPPPRADRSWFQQSMLCSAPPSRLHARNFARFHIYRDILDRLIAVEVVRMVLLV
jgi:hypothetical protein